MPRRKDGRPRSVPTPANRPAGEPARSIDDAERTDEARRATPPAPAD